VLAAAIERMTDHLRTLGPLQWPKTTLRQEGICPTDCLPPAAEPLRDGAAS